jgi:hypothetical protein
VLAISSARRSRTTTAAAQSPLVHTWVSVACIGGPLALVALYLPPIFGDAAHHATAVTLLGVGAFAALTAIWCAYSRRISSPGGLYAFTTAVAGRRVGLVQATLWTISYLLYLLYTTDYVVYSILPSVVGGIAAWQPVLEIAIPVGLVAIVLAPLRVALTAVAAIAVAQVVVAVALVVASLGSSARPAGVAAGQGIRGSAASAGQVGLLFVCASLPLFLGGEVVGGGRTVRRSLVAAVGGVGALAVAAALPVDALPAYAGSEVPGAALAGEVLGRGFATAVGVGVAVSVLALVAVEYLALTRLAHAVAGWPVHAVARRLAVPLVVAAVVSLSAPEQFYADLLRPSLIALWLAQLPPVLAYPWFAAQTARLRARDIAITAVATALVGYGLAVAATSSVAT